MNCKVEVLGFQHFYSNYSLVFKVFTRQKGYVLLRIDSGYDDQNKYIIFLDANKLARILSPKDYFNFDNIHDFTENQEFWHTSKVDQCIQGFDNCQRSPIPLSDISFFDNEIRYTNGITRLNWLLSYGAEIIPAKTDVDSVRALQDLFGANTFEAKTLKTYFDEYSKLTYY